MIQGGKKKTIKKFIHDGNKYIIEQLENNYCVRKGKTYMCNKDVKTLTKQIRGGVPVELSNDTSEKNVKRIPYEERKKFLDNLEITSPNDFSPYFPIMQDKETGTKFTLTKTLQQGSFGIAGLMASKETPPRQFVLKIFFDDPKYKEHRPAAILARDREIEVIDRLNKEGLLEESIYAKTITYNKVNKYVLMELGQSDLFSFLELVYDNKLQLTPCDCVKIAYSIFKEVLYIFEKTGLLYSDIKLENFLYTHTPEDVLHIVMADYGSLADYDVTFGEGVTTTYIKVPPGAVQSRWVWKNNWDNVGFILGIVIIQLLGEYQESADKISEYNTVMKIINHLPAKLLKNEKILLNALTQLKNEPDDLENIIKAFKNYEELTKCNLNNLPASIVA